MAQPRWLSPWKDDPRVPARYHVVNRVVDRRMVFGPAEREKFRSLLRRYEGFSGCRVLTYCMLSNHFHILLEVPPMPAGGLSEAEFFRRLGALYSEARVGALRAEIEDCRRRGNAAAARALVASHTYRMHDLGEFMKGLTQRFSVWFNRSRGRVGRLWEERFKSLIVEGGIATRAVAAYIDLNPVRAGLARDPADYRWSGYGEAAAESGGSVRSRAREGLARALGGCRGRSPDRADRAVWEGGGGVGREYRRILLAGAGEIGAAGGPEQGGVQRRGMDRETLRREIAALEEAGGAAGAGDLAVGRVAARRVRHFTDGTALGGRTFVDGVFAGCRERFGPKRPGGARKPRGALAALRGEIWTLRDLQTDIE